MMRTRNVLLFFAAVIVIGFAGGGVIRVATDRGPAPAAAAAVSPMPSESKLVAKTVDEAGFISGLRAIDPALVVDEDRAVDRAENICLDVEQGKDGATIADNARQRYSGGQVTVTLEQAELIVVLARSFICLG